MLQGSPQDPDPYLDSAPVYGTQIESWPGYSYFWHTSCHYCFGFGINVLAPGLGDQHSPLDPGLSSPSGPVSPVAPGRTCPDPIPCTHTPPPAPPTPGSPLPPALHSHGWGRGSVPRWPCHTQPCLCIPTFTLQSLWPLTHQLVNKLQNHSSSLWHLNKQPVSPVRVRAPWG